MKIKEVIRKKQNRLKNLYMGVLAVSAATVSLFPPDCHGFRGK
mgnify:CR=1 FL=1